MPEPRWLEEADNRAPRVPLMFTPTPIPMGSNPNAPNVDPERVASAYVRSTGASEGRDYGNRWVSKVSTKPRYVIVGRGFCAAVNFATLLRTPEGRSLLQEYPPVIVGFDDPWFMYRKHEMNQEREVLTLPGFEKQLYRQRPGRLYCERLHRDFPERTLPFVLSSEFADRTCMEWLYLENEAKEYGIPFEVKTANVDRIVKGETGLFQVMLERGASIPAKYVDLCVGPGQSRILPHGTGRYQISMPSSLRKEYEEPASDWSTSYAPRVVSGSEYTRANVVTPGGAVVLVQGAGPAAGQAVEEAFRMGAAEVFWVTSRTHHGAFIPNERIDFLVEGRKKTDTTGPWHPLPNTDFHAYSLDRVGDTYDLRPRIEDLWLGTASIQEIVFTERQRLRVTFDKAVTGMGVGGVTRSNGFGVFDQVIIAQGRESDYSKPGSPGYIVRELDFEAFRPISRPGVKCEGASFALGLELFGEEDSRVRLLGSAGLSAFKKDSPENYMLSKKLPEALALRDFQDTLPAEARVFFQGVTLAGVTVAYANGYFDGTGKFPNTNRNTSTKDELIVLEGGTDANVTYAGRKAGMRAITEDHVGGSSRAMYHVPKEYPYRRTDTF